jgi:hypothetical protein
MGNSDKRRRHQAGPLQSRTALRTIIALAALTGGDSMRQRLTRSPLRLGETE